MLQQRQRNPLCSSKLSSQMRGHCLVVCHSQANSIPPSPRRLSFYKESYNLKTFPSDNSKLAELEFYLVDDLECDLTVFHPYRTLMALCKKEGSDKEEVDIAVEAGEL